MVRYEHYKAGAEVEIVELWNRTLTFDPLTGKRFRNLVLLDANFDPQGLRLAYADADLVGCLYAVRRLLPMLGTELEVENGWIPFFFVQKDYRRQGIGQALLAQGLQFLKNAGRSYAYFASYAPNYILPGIDQKAYPSGWRFLQKAGFEKLYSPVAMDRSLVGFSIPPEIRKLKKEREGEGYLFRTASDSDLVELIEFASESFNPDWGRAIREGILRGLPLDWIFLARHKERIVGFALHGAYEGVAERFGPFGVDPKQRGKGLGKVLLNLCLGSMQAWGLHGAWFLWTGETSPAGYLYLQTGFKITRQFHVCRKCLD